MATSADVCNSSDDIDKPLCKPCGEDGEQLNAVGFCYSCSEYLCRKCFDVHLIPTITRKHVLRWLEKSEEADTTHESKYPCQQHGDEHIKYHCPTHSFFGCHVCSFRHQNSCKDVIYIPDITMPTSDPGECGTLFTKLTNITRMCAELVSEVRSSLETISSIHTEAITTVRDFKQELIDIIEKLENELVEKIDMHQIDETKRMKELAISCETILKDAQKMSASMEVLQNNDRNFDLYIEIVQSKDKILILEDQLKLMERNKHVNMPVFQPNKESTDLLTSPGSLGSLNLKSNIIEKLEHLQNINCKTKKDRGNCIMVGSVLLSGLMLIVTDRNTGNAVKLIDLQQNKISLLKLSPYTYGICKITDTSVAVTVPEHNKVMFLSTIPTLAVKGGFKLNKQPWGIAHFDGKLVVSFYDPYRLEMMNMEGKLMTTITTGIYGKTLFKWPCHVAVHPGNKRIYVSNMESHNVVCMTIDGTVVATYKDNELIGPRQITFDSSGMVYVCGEESHNVHQITPDCQKVKVILTTKHGLNKPCSITYEENEDLFYIGGWSNSIKVYKGANSAL